MIVIGRERPTYSKGGLANQQEMAFVSRPTFKTVLILSQLPVLLARHLFLRFNYGLNEPHSTAPGTGREPDRGG